MYDRKLQQTVFLTEDTMRIPYATIFIPDTD